MKKSEIRRRVKRTNTAKKNPMSMLASVINKKFLYKSFLNKLKLIVHVQKTLTKAEEEKQRKSLFMIQNDKTKEVENEYSEKKSKAFEDYKELRHVPMKVELPKNEADEIKFIRVSTTASIIVTATRLKVIKIWINKSAFGVQYKDEMHNIVEDITDVQISKDMSRIVVGDCKGNLTTFTKRIESKLDTNNTVEIEKPSDGTDNLMEYKESSQPQGVVDFSKAITKLFLNRDGSLVILSTELGAILILRLNTTSMNIGISRYEGIARIVCGESPVTIFDALRYEYSEERKVLTEQDEEKEKIALLTGINLAVLNVNTLFRERNHFAPLKNPPTKEKFVKITLGPPIIVSGRKDGVIQFWGLDVTNSTPGLFEYTCKETIKDAHSKEVTQISISSTADIVISCSLDRTVKVWIYNVEEDRHEPLKRIFTFESEVVGLKYLDRTNEIIIAYKGIKEKKVGKDREAKTTSIGYIDLLKFDSEKKLYKIKDTIETDGLLKVFDSTIYGDIVVGIVNNSFQKWGMKLPSSQYEVQAEPMVYTIKITCLAVGTDGNEISVGLENGEVNIWKLRPGGREFMFNQTISLGVDNGEVNSIALGYSKKVLIYSNKNGGVEVFKYITGYSNYARSPECCITFTAKKEILLFKTNRNMSILLILWADSFSIYTQKDIKHEYSKSGQLGKFVTSTKIEATNFLFKHADLSGEGYRIVTSCTDSSVRFYEWKEKTSILEPHKIKLISISSLPEHIISYVKIGEYQKLAMVGCSIKNKQYIQVYKETGQEYQRTQEIKFPVKKSEEISCMSLSANEEQLVVSLSNGNMYLFLLNQAIDEYIAIAELVGPRSKVIDCNISGESKRDRKIFSCTESGRVQLWGENRAAFTASAPLAEKMVDVLKIQEDGPVLKQKKIEELAEHLYGESDYIVHSSINILYLAVLSRSTELIERLLSMFGYKQWLYDQNEDPLEISLELGENEIVNIFVDFLRSQEKPYFKLDEEKLTNAIISTNETYKSYIISRFLPEGKSIIGMPDNLYGISIEFTHGYPSKTFYKDQNYLKYITEKFVTNFMQDDKPSSQPYEVKYVTTSYPTHLSLRNKNIHQIIGFLENTSKDVMLSDIKALVKHLWEMNFKFVLLYFILYFIFAGLTIFNVVLCPNDEVCVSSFSANKIPFGKYMILPFRYGFLVLLPIIYCLLVYYEYSVLRQRRVSYFRYPTNWIRLFNVIAFPFVYLFMIYDFGMFSKSWFFFTLTFYLGTLGFMAIYHLKFVDGVRRMNSMFSYIFYEIRYYFLLIVLILSVYSMLRTEIDTLYADVTGWIEEWIGYPEPLVNYITEEVMPVIALNIPIAIIAAALHKFETYKEYKDLSSMCYILFDFGSLLSYIPSSASELSFYHFVISRPASSPSEHQSFISRQIFKMDTSIRSGELDTAETIKKLKGEEEDEEEEQEDMIGDILDAGKKFLADDEEEEEDDDDDQQNQEKEGDYLNKALGIVQLGKEKLLKKKKNEKEKIKQQIEERKKTLAEMEKKKKIRQDRENEEYFEEEDNQPSVNSEVSEEDPYMKEFEEKKRNKIAENDRAEKDTSKKEDSDSEEIHLIGEENEQHIPSIERTTKEKKGQIKTFSKQMTFEDLYKKSGKRITSDIMNRLNSNIQEIVNEQNQVIDTLIGFKEDLRNGINSQTEELNKKLKEIEKKITPSNKIDNILNLKKKSTSFKDAKTLEEARTKFSKELKRKDDNIEVKLTEKKKAIGNLRSEIKNLKDAIIPSLQTNEKVFQKIDNRVSLFLAEQSKIFEKYRNEPFSFHNKLVNEALQSFKDIGEDLIEESEVFKSKFISKLNEIITNRSNTESTYITEMNNLKRDKNNMLDNLSREKEKLESKISKYQLTYDNESELRIYEIEEEKLSYGEDYELKIIELLEKSKSDTEMSKQSLFNFFKERIDYANKMFKKYLDKIIVIYSESMDLLISSKDIDEFGFLKNKAELVLLCKKKEILEMIFNEELKTSYDTISDLITVFNQGIDVEWELSNEICILNQNKCNARINYLTKKRKANDDSSSKNIKKADYDEIDKILVEEFKELYNLKAKDLKKQERSWDNTRDNLMRLELESVESIIRCRKDSHQAISNLHIKIGRTIMNKQSLIAKLAVEFEELNKEIEKKVTFEDVDSKKTPFVQDSIMENRLLELGDIDFLAAGLPKANLPKMKQILLQKNKELSQAIKEMNVGKTLFKERMVLIEEDFSQEINNLEKHFNQQKIELAIQISHATKDTYDISEVTDPMILIEVFEKEIQVMEDQIKLSEQKNELYTNHLKNLQIHFTTLKDKILLAFKEEEVVLDNNFEKMGSVIERNTRILKESMRVEEKGLGNFGDILYNLQSVHTDRSNFIQRKFREILAHLSEKESRLTLYKTRIGQYLQPLEEELLSNFASLEQIARQEMLIKSKLLTQKKKIAEDIKDDEKKAKALVSIKDTESAYTLDYYKFLSEIRAKRTEKVRAVTEYMDRINPEIDIILHSIMKERGGEESKLHTELKLIEENKKIGLKYKERDLRTKERILSNFDDMSNASEHILTQQMKILNKRREDLQYSLEQINSNISQVYADKTRFLKENKDETRRLIEEKIDYLNRKYHDDAKKQSILLESEDKAIVDKELEKLKEDYRRMKDEQMIKLGRLEKEFEDGLDLNKKEEQESLREYTEIQRQSLDSIDQTIADLQSRIFSVRSGGYEASIGFLYQGRSPIEAVTDPSAPNLLPTDDSRVKDSALPISTTKLLDMFPSTGKKKVGFNFKLNIKESDAIQNRNFNS